MIPTQKEKDLNRYIEDVNSMSITSLDQRVLRTLCEESLERAKKEREHPITDDSIELKNRGEILIKEDIFMAEVRALEMDIIKEIKKSTLRSSSVYIDIKNLFIDFKNNINRIRLDE